MSALLSRAAAQRGLITRKQCLDVMGPDRLWRAAQKGTLVRVLPGVYRVSGAPISWEQEVLAACLWAGDAVASHTTAAALHGLDGFPRPDRGGPVEVITRKRAPRADALHLHPWSPIPGFTVVREGILITNAALTNIDLAGAGLGVHQLDRALDDALRRRLTSMRHLHWAIQQLRSTGRRGPQRLARLLDERDPDGPSASAFQKEVRKLICRYAAFEEEHVICDAQGTFVARVDFADVDRHVIVEAEGAGTHSGRDDWWHDLRRRNRVTALGWQVLHVVPEDLERPDEFLAALRALLAGSNGRSPCTMPR